jgi:hypothetical protein
VQKEKKKKISKHIIVGEFYIEQQYSYVEIFSFNFGTISVATESWREEAIQLIPFITQKKKKILFHTSRNDMFNFLLMLFEGRK